MEHESFFEKNSEASSSQKNQWQQMAEDAPPFRKSETTEPRAEDTEDKENYEYRDIDEIDLSTDEGRIDWVNGLLHNARVNAQERIDQAKWSLNDTAESELSNDVEVINNQKDFFDKVLLDPQLKTDGLLNVMERHWHQAAENEDQLPFMYSHQAGDLYLILRDEVAKCNNAEYFNGDSIGGQLEGEIAAMEKHLEAITPSGFVREDGRIEMTKDVEKASTPLLRKAENAVDIAKRDLTVYETILQEYQAANDYAERISSIDRAEFSSFVKHFIGQREMLQNQLEQELAALPEGSPEYTEKSAQIMQLQRERKSAQRLSEKYFSTL